MKGSNKNSIFNNAFIWLGLIFFFLFKLKKQASTSEGAFLSSLPVDNNALAGNYVGQTNTETMLKSWVDDVVQHLNGAGVMFYPEIVNRCTNFKCNELKYAMAYYNVKYKGAIDYTFYSFLNWESVMPQWAGFHPYQPALDKIEACKLMNY